MVDHLVKRRGVFYWRRKLPSGIQVRAERSHVWRSLGTPVLKRAAPTARRLSTALDDAFAMIKSHPELTSEEINRVLRKYIQDALIAAEREQRLPAWQSEADRQKQLDALDIQFGDIADDLRFFDSTAEVERLADRLIEENGLALGKGTDRYKAFCRRVAMAELERLRAEQALLDRYYGDILPNTAGEPVGETGAAPAKATAGPTLSEVLPQYVDEMSRSAWTPKTRQQTEQTFRLFKETVGDLAITAVSRGDVAKFKDALATLPKSYGKSPKDRELPITELAKRSGPRIAPKTVKRHLTSLNGFFRWCKERGLREGDSPASGFRFPKSKRAREERPAWRVGELQTLFASPVWTGCSSASRRSTPGCVIIKDALYWVPLIACFAGLRLEEAAQLRVSDLQQEDGIYFLNIHAEQGNQLKSKAAVRRVPIHPELIRMGLLDYAESVGDTGGERLFPELEPGGPDKRFGFYLSKKFSRYRGRVGLSRKGTDLHALRATFATVLQNAGVDQTTAADLLGHEIADMTYGRYGKGLELRVLNEAVEKVVYPGLDLAHLTGPR